MRGAVLRSMSLIEMYPIVIRQARYGGAYEGGAWLCFPNADHEPPESAFGDDGECFGFWQSHRSRLIGRGDTPDKALMDMFIRVESNNKPKPHNPSQLYWQTQSAIQDCTNPKIAALLSDILYFIEEKFDV